MSRQLCRLFAGIEAFTVAYLTAATMRIAGGSATLAVREVRSSYRKAPAPAAVAFGAARVRAVTGARHSTALRPVVGPAVPNPKSPAGSHSDTFASRSFPHSISFKHNLIPKRSNHTREASHFITFCTVHRLSTHPG
jgi:hypothetical protein